VPDPVSPLVELAKLTYQLTYQQFLAAGIERTLKELEFHGVETSGERFLSARLNELLGKATVIMSALRDAETSEASTQQLSMLRETIEDVDWEIASETYDVLRTDEERRARNLVASCSQADEYEKLFTEAYAQIEEANRRGVRLAREAKYVGGTIESIKKVKRAVESKAYRDVPRLLESAVAAVNQAPEKIGSTLAKKEQLEDCLKIIRDRVEKSRPFSTQADLLLLHSRSTDSVDYTVLLRTPSRPGTHGVNIQGSSTLVEQDRSEFSQKVADIAKAIQTASARGVSAFPLDGTVEPSEPQAEDQIRILGDLLCRLVLPEDMQRYLPDNPSSITITTNDLQLPWELMCFGDKILCLEQPVSRMPMGYAIPKKVKDRIPRDQKRFLLMWSDPQNNLKFVRKEIENIAGALECEPGTEVEVIEGVTGRQLNDHLLNSDRYDVIHYAGHAYFDDARPERSSLLVHTDGSTGNLAKYERYFAQKIRRLLKGQPLAFLNACETGHAAPERNEDYTLRTPAEGLASAFVYAGALGCVGSLWPVQDKCAADFAIAFYRQLLDGETLGEAMRQARMNVRARYPNSATWATFMLYGDPTFRL
jgi:CHAT domain